MRARVSARSTLKLGRGDVLLGREEIQWMREKERAGLDEVEDENREALAGG